MTPGLRLPDVRPMPVSRDIKTIVDFGRRYSKNWSLFHKLPKYIDVTDHDDSASRRGVLGMVICAIKEQTQPHKPCNTHANHASSPTNS